MSYSDIPLKIGENLYYLCKIYGISNRKVSVDCGKSENTIYNLRSGSKSDIEIVFLFNAIDYFNKICLTNKYKLSDLWKKITRLNT